VPADVEDVYNGAPVAATTIARALHPEPTHSTAVRVGLALSRLRAAGRVRMVLEPTSHRPARWAPAEADDA
jgi:hypothetical protein